MSIANKFRRLISLYKLLWATDRLDALEAQRQQFEVRLQQVNEELDAVNRRAGAATAVLQSQMDEARTDTSGLGETMYQLAAQAGSQLKILAEDQNALKSSLEVPQKMVDDFLAWKSQNQIPAHPLVTVIVATYNRSRLLTERCIPSILGQTYDNLELIAFSKLRRFRVSEGRHGSCIMTGATLELDFPAEAFTSDSATVQVIPPEGDPVSVDFNLTRLR